ncbi:hypothetical protein GQ457_02G030010 [Hibiscus cannabinus]
MLFILSEGARESAHRSSAQPGSSRSVQPRQPIITRSHTAADRDTDLHMFSGSYLLYCLLFQNYCMPTDFPDLLFTVPTLRPRINPYGPEVTHRVAPTPFGPRILWIGRTRIDIGGSTLLYSSTFLYVSIFRFVLLLLVTCAYALYIVWHVYCSTLLLF